MVVYSRKDPLMCPTFPFSLKGVSWFSLPPHSLCNFEEVFETFLTQYASHREAKRNNHHLLTVKMSQNDNLKSYIGYFQSQLDTVPNCDEDFSALVFISGLQFSHPLYNHLLKHNVNQMSEALSRAQPYIQLEEAMMTFANHSAKRGDDRGKSKSPHEAAAYAQDQNEGQSAYKRQALPILSQSPL